MGAITRAPRRPGVTRFDPHWRTSRPAQAQAFGVRLFNLKYLRGLRGSQCGLRQKRRARICEGLLSVLVPPLRRIIRRTGIDLRRSSAVVPMKDDDGKIFAQRLIAARMRRGWGPRELAMRASTYSSLISLYESRQRLPTQSELIALADALDVQPDDLWPSRSLHVQTPIDAPGKAP